ncbi:MAG: glycosyl transferase family 1 [Spirochaetes bacterium GWF1_41_5]|nr:MAG: glycosyl transferase family 1 [Spirochaetes bacterium GWF1_41_5]HBE01020.1 glycosyl transferase family 1 [Spirochaetia bacterium]
MERVSSIAIIGNYLPRRCGIATFTTDLATALSANREIKCWALAVNDRPEGYKYPEKVRFEINQNLAAEYRLAADYLNINQVDAVSLQHEYGIFGGDSGRHILSLIRELRMPVVTTLHTVLKNPSPEQKKVLCEIAEISSRLVVMAEKGVTFLKDIYGIAEQKISMIHHGIPDMPFVDSNFYKDQFGVDGKKVILTFGLLSPNKGIASMIEALPAIVSRHPDAVYIIVGATHPHVKKTRGEEYRQTLERLAKSKGVDRHIMFFNRFVDFSELCEFLGACDVYVTPYLNEAQIVSGTLAYAMGAGKASVSTPYWYAEEMIGSDRGLLVGFNDPQGLAQAINKLLEDDNLRNAIRKRAYAFSRRAVWSQVAADYISVFNEVKNERSRGHGYIFKSKTLESEKESLPEIKLDHLHTLTDASGIIQHAIYTIPDYNHGYCTDDNARALIAMVMAQELIADDPQLVCLQKKYLAFIQHAFNSSSGWFRNFMSFNRSWLEEKGSEDCQGRAIWSLGVSSALSADPGCAWLSSSLFHQSLAMLESLTHPRALAFALVGIHAYLARFSGDSEVRRTRESLAFRLFDKIKNRVNTDWPWFENESVTYANAKIPHALLLSGQWMQRSDMLQAGYRLLDWLVSLQKNNNCFSPIGNRGWYKSGGPKALFDQQPIEAQAMLETCLLAKKMSGNDFYYDFAALAFNWFLGQNDLKQPLYDYTTGGCRDGLSPDGASLNQGAESTLSWLLSLIAMHGFRAEQKKLQYIEPIS